MELYRVHTPLAVAGKCGYKSKHMQLVEIRRSGANDRDRNDGRVGTMEAASPAVFAKSSISIGAAGDLIKAADAEARALGVPVAIAVMDESGLLKAFARQDGASVVAGELAIDKAYTAAAMGFGVSTAQLAEVISGDRPLELNFSGRGRLAFVGGGHPVVIAGVVIGAVGVAGGHCTQDAQIASAAIEALT